MSKPDNNLFSYNGPEYNGQSLGNGAGVYGHSTPAPDWQDTLKYTTKLQNFTHRVGHVFGGTEDCVDVNNECTGVAVIAKGFWSGGKYVATVKGGSFGITLRGSIYKSGSEVDVDLGNWSDQSAKKTSMVFLDLVKPEDREVTVRVLNAHKPILAPASGPYRYVFPHPDSWYHGAAVWFFMRFRRFWK
jgi:hypothetical protein